jgi:molecular chaperone GrpE
VTNDRHDDDAPVIKVTDKRRFAGADTGETPSVSPVPDVADGADVSDANVAAAGDVPDELAAGAEDRSEVDEYRAHLQRLQAEFDNYRKRVLREQTAAVEMAAEPVMRRLLEVLDDFELALLHANDDVDTDRLLKGVELVYAKLLDALQSEGLERIEAEGQRFDPSMHEALMQTGEGEGEPHVAEVFRQGYTLRGRVIRPAGVRVERGE